MSNAILNKTTYTLYLSSADKISGTNNNATYQVNFDDFLPRKYNNYKMNWCCSTAGGTYKDNSSLGYSGAKVFVDFGVTTFSFDTSTKSQSNCIGYIYRDPQGTTTTSNALSCCFGQNAPKTINRPNQNMITIKIYNLKSPTVLLTDTDNASPSVASGDCTSYSLTMEFTPIDDRLVANEADI